MKKITHYYSLTPEWQTELAKQLETKVIDNKLIIVPKDLGKGFFYFTSIMPGISVVFADLNANEPLKITRQASDNPIYIFHFDLSEHTNLIKINNVDYEIGAFNQLDLAIIDNELESSFKPAVKERTIALRILVDKKLLTTFIRKVPYPENKTVQTETVKTSFYHYGNIDSNSILLINSLKDKSVTDTSFDSFLKGISLKVLGNFFNKFYQAQSNDSHELIEFENKAIERTKEYLINNLHGAFPSIAFLAGMAGMSASKYKTLFKKRYHDTPKNVFINEKIDLAQKLLKSGKYKTLTQVMYDLNYSKLSYFIFKYNEKFQRKPSEDFVKKA